jgi:sugar lactone lactonase YvrE
MQGRSFQLCAFYLQRRVGVTGNQGRANENWLLSIALLRIISARSINDVKGENMKSILKACLPLLLVAVASDSGTAIADDDHSRRLFIDRDVDTFAVLPEGVKFPEGITANPRNGDIFVGTFEGGAVNKLLRFDRRGRLEATRIFGVTPLLGLEFDRVNRKVYIANVGNFVGMASKIQRIAANFNGGTAVEDVAVIPHLGAPLPRTVINPDNSPNSPSFDTITFGNNANVPNAMVFDKNGNLYISDSFQGAIFRITNPAGCAPGCVVNVIRHDPLLATAGFPPFGANGLALSRDEKALFIANTGDDRILKLDLIQPQSVDALSVFAESINGADGLAIDRRGRVWVAANQADEVLALNEDGKIVARLGEFRGVRGNGTPNGLLFPASLVIVDDEIFVTNLALALTPTAGDEPEEDVTRWTISRLKMPRH